MNTIQSGFGSGFPRSGKLLGVREAGSAPTRVPGAMLRALGVGAQSSYNVVVDEGDVDKILAGYDDALNRDEYQASAKPWTGIFECYANCTR